LKSGNLLSHSLWEVDKSELIFIEKVASEPREVPHISLSAIGGLGEMHPALRIRSHRLGVVVCHKPLGQRRREVVIIHPDLSLSA
jgi:hypothetical protein